MFGSTHTCAPPSSSSSSPVRPCPPLFVFSAQCASLSSFESNVLPQVQVRRSLVFKLGSLDCLS